MNKIVSIGLVVLGMVVHLPQLSLSEERPPADVIRAAEEGIKTFAKMSQNRNLYGSAVLPELSESVLGEGFQVFTVPPDKLLAARPDQGLLTLAVPTSQWEFLVLSEGKAKATLTVDLVNNVWTAVSFGKAGLAQQLETVLKTWPISSDYRFRLIRVYQATSDFIVLSKGDEVEGVIPLTSARVAMGLEYKSFNPMDLRSPNEVVTDLIPIVRANILKTN